MELSEHERRVLGEIEAAMAAENPRLASTLGNASLGKTTRIRPRLRSRGASVAARIGTYVITLIVGVVLLSVGLRLKEGTGTVLGVLGCVLIVAATTAVVSHRRADPDWRRPGRSNGGRPPRGRGPRR